MAAPHIFIVAVENSSDQLGAGLIAALKEMSPDVKISAVGGSAMAAQGATSEVDTKGLSILGFAEALRAYPLVMKRVKQTVQAILKGSPDAVVLIDSWGFMIRVSQRLKRSGYKGEIIKYVAPQVWAMREGRAKTLAKSNDHVLSIHSFDAPYFEKHGLAVSHVGNPMFDTDYSAGDAPTLRKELGLAPEQRICAALFGSRLSEFTQLRAPILSAVAQLKARHPDLVFISPVSNTLREHIIKDASEGEMAWVHLVPEDRKFDVFAAADAAIACSGTVTTQLASVGIPTVVLYKLKASTWWIAKKLYKPSYISLINISAGKPLMPELLQDEARGEMIAAQISTFLDNEALRSQRSKELMREAAIMRGSGDGSASDSAAEKILELISD